jgi:phosphopentomutase
MIDRIVLLIIDACGVGELPDAELYGDRGAATIPNVARDVGGLSLPTCQSLGLGSIVEIDGVPAVAKPAASYGRSGFMSAGKDSTSGHWELGGAILDQPLPLFPEGFPPALVSQFEKAAGIRTIGNVPASGTEIIARLGEEHLRTKELILYTSADSVFQLAAHEELYPPEELYRICRIAREMLTGEYGVGRVIARPFVGKPGSFQRTANRKDFSREPDIDTFLDVISQSGCKALAIGKIFDLYAGRGLNYQIKAKDNSAVMSAVSKAVAEDRGHDLIFANCVDFDMLWGHRNDVEGFARGLEEFDRNLAELLPRLRYDDLLIITADHGCDPTLKHSTDHTREYVPILAYARSSGAGVDLGTRDSLADVGKTVLQALGLENDLPGRSFWPELRIR